jgi:hypothetical protein
LSALGVILGDGTEVRKGNTYEQGESRREEGRQGNGWMSPYRDHAIELECEPSPGFCKVYLMTLTEQAEMDAFLEEALATGCIRQPKSPLGVPVFFIKKKDGKLRFVQDYRALNAITRKNQYPLPQIDNLIHRLKDTCYFTKLDVFWGYNNVRIHEGDEWKAAFRTNRGLFEPLVMYFSLTNSPATFQTMMNEIF